MFQIDLLPELTGLWRVFATLVLVALAAGISIWQRLDLERDMAIAVVRSFVQLIAIGYVLEIIFEFENPIWIILMLMIMTTTAALTARQRGKGLPQAGLLAFFAIGIGALVTLFSLVLVGVFTFDAQTMVPVGGLVIGAGLTTASLTLNRLVNDFKRDRHEIEQGLALGASPRQAARRLTKQAIHSAMIPSIDSAKSVGLVKLPGAMTGLILAGVAPLQAVQIQIIVMYMLITSAALTGLITALIGSRLFFTQAQQLNHHLILSKGPTENLAT
ncbi:MAG: iron export ABC transporter permease subunit FetB [Chloroflexota bacterium]